MASTIRGSGGRVDLLGADVYRLELFGGNVVIFLLLNRVRRGKVRAGRRAGSDARMLKHLFGYLVSVPRLLSVAVPTRHPSAGGLRPLPGVGLSVRSVEPMVRLRYE